MAKLRRAEAAGLTDHLPLFSLIGNRYGGDGVHNFNLPKMPPLPTGEGGTLGYFISTGGIYPTRR